MHTRLAAAVERLGRPRVFVIGDLILDRYLWGSVTRISPEAPVQVLDAEREEFRVGGAANVAHNVASLGARASCGGVVGRDAWGAEFLRDLRRLGISTSPVLRDGSRPTTVKTRLLAHNQQMIRIDRERRDPLTPALERSLIAAIRREARTADLALVSDYHKGTMTPAVSKAVVREFARRGKPVLVGLKNRDMAKYRGATGASLNRGELAQLSGAEGVEQGARIVLRKLGLQYLVVTLGEKGMRVYDRTGQVAGLAAEARQVYDVTGAGDTVLAAFSVGRAAGLGLEDCALLATAAAGIVVAKVGTATATRRELLDAASHPEAQHRKVLKVAALGKALAEERKRDRRIVFTNGCFDLLHAGHLRSLQFAKSRGDVLVVGLNSDRSVRRLKGPGRPILPAAERSALLAGLECVDYVALFDADTPAELIRAVRPDVLVKGEDYAGRKVVGRDVVEARGGRVELVPLVPGISTTDLVARIRRLP